MKNKEILEALELAAQYVAKTEGQIPRDSQGKNIVTPDLEKIREAIKETKRLVAENEVFRLAWGYPIEGAIPL